MGMVRVAATLALLAILTLVLMPLQLLAMGRGWRLAATIPQFWQRVACRLVGIRVRVEGIPAAPPLLIATNHVSWLDVPVLGSVLPVSFIAKAEVATWPAVRTLARLQRTVFIDRTKRAKTASATKAIARRVAAGDIMVLFAEGTTGDGNRILPFRSALLGAASAAAGSGMTRVQPVAIRYTGLRGLPIDRAERPLVAWYGDMDLAPHFMKVVGIGVIDVVVRFGEPIAFGPDADRKKVALACFASVRAMLSATERTPAQLPNRGLRDAAPRAVASS
jgi:1-acyl-sn-glycerol-3-phosphate acyltransferase